MVHVCSLCGYKYDEEKGDPANNIAPGTKWEEVEAGYKCPLCGAGKAMFNPA